jgi:predicted CoA-binding protein
MTNFKDSYIAVVGVSLDSAKYGNKVFSDMVKAGWHVEGIHLGGGEVAGRKLYSSLDELAEVPDIVVTVVPPEVTEKVVQEAIDKGVKHVWMQPGSESEAGIEKAKAAGIEVTYNQCIMITSGLW